ncbi:MAG TPA: GNAT family N-acetyltransferase [Pirellulaceae bacterium]|nr:GNAT family N-acetyltransferase [Pirellulaceae bacterium]
MPQEIVIRPAAHSRGTRGRLVLQEIFSFGERAGIAEHEAGKISDVSPLVLFGADRLLQCDEAFVAVSGEQIVGAVTLASNGVYAPKVPTLDALYVLPEFHRQGIGLALVERATRRFVELGKVPVLCKVESEEMRALLHRLDERFPALRQQIRAFIDS